jgi:short-subunit dehydrogenase
MNIVTFIAEKNWILVTGSSSGLGMELAKHFAKQGFNILLHGRDYNKLKKLKEIIQNLEVECEFVTGELKEDQCLKNLVHIAREKGVKILINNAAILCQGRPLADLEQSYVDEALLINVRTPMYLIKSLINDLTQIININSIAGYERKKNRTVYCATKSALKAFSETLSLETDVRILDVYISKLKKNPSDYGLKMETVASEIYKSFSVSDRSLILDGRKDSQEIVRNKQGF